MTKRAVRVGVSTSTWIVSLPKAPLPTRRLQPRRPRSARAARPPLPETCSLSSSRNLTPLEIRRPHRTAPRAASPHRTRRTRVSFAVARRGPGGQAWTACQSLPRLRGILSPASMAPTRRLELADRSRDRRPPVEWGRVEPASPSTPAPDAGCPWPGCVGRGGGARRLIGHFVCSVWTLTLGVMQSTAIRTRGYRASSRRGRGEDVDLWASRTGVGDATSSGRGR